MSIVKDSTEVKTVIPYPKKDKIVTTTTVTERNALEGKTLYSPSYESVLLSATILSIGLLFSAYLYYKRQKETVLLDYFNFRQTEKKHIHISFFSIILDLLGVVVISALGYYFLTFHTSYDGWGAFIGVMLGALSLFLSCVLFIFITDYLVGDKGLAIKHFQLYYFSVKMTALALLPFLLLTLFFPEKGYWIVLWAVLLIFIFRGIILFILIHRFLRLSGFSIFHSFLYLCTLELLPVLYAAILIEFLIYK